ncbi:MAG: hypothetical protein LUG98_09120 [Tannerellaceae bacterium]|nr:hypothetical protein [Tannerellaceae bacterium]
MFITLLFTCLFVSSTAIYAQDRKIVLLKLDDVHYGNNGAAVPPRWDKVADYLEGKQIKAGFGIIGYSLAEDHPGYFQWIKDRADRGYIEFWNHGYYNRGDGDTIGEFERSYEEQYRALFLTDSLAKANLGLTLRVWGPHWSSTNEDTDRALSNMPGIRMTLGSPRNPEYFKGYVFPNNLQMEYPVHNPNFDEFVKSYKGEWKDLDFFYLQGHPNSWDDTRWDNFVRIIEFLESENVRFVTPTEFMELMGIEF